MPAALSIDTAYLTNYTAEEDIRSFKTTSSSDFSALINTRNSINLYSKQSLEHSEQVSEAAFPIDYNNRSNIWATGTKFPGKVLILNESGRIFSHTLNPALDYIAFTSTGNIFASVGSQKTYLIEFPSGRKIWGKAFGKGLERLQDSLNSDNNSFSEKLISTGENKLIFKSHSEKWSISKEEFLGGTFLGSDRILIWRERGLSLLHVENGSSIWEKSVEAKRFRPAVVDDKVFYLAGDRLMERDLETGEKSGEYRIDHYASGLKRFPGKEWLVARQGDNLSIFTLEGEKLGSFDTGGMDEGYQFTQYDRDSMKEVAYGDGKTVHIVDIGEERFEFNSSLPGTAFVGNGREMLEAVALNRTAFVTKEFGDVAAEVNRTGLEPLGVGEVRGLESTEEIEDVFNISRKGYYAGSREKSVYVAAFAAADNASLTFDSSGADRDFSNYSVRELKERFIERFEPHHVVVADLDSDSGTLAAYMAVRQDALPVDFGQEFSHPGSKGVNASRWNRDNGVIKLDRKIERAFDGIGENRNTVFEGRYVSLLSGPRRMYTDPVDRGIIGDSKDGERFFSDLEYGDLDGDGRLEAGVGRYPGEVGKASAVYHRSLERNQGKDAVLAGEYLHSRWPVILATFGGGMWDVKNLGYVMEQQGFEVTRRVEQRSKPFALVSDLVGFPTRMDIFTSEMRSAQEKLGSFLGASGAAAAKNAAFMIRGLSYAERVLQLYLEFDWMNWDPVGQELDFPDEVSRGEMRELFLSFLPDRHGRLNRETLTQSMEDHDIIYLQLVGNSTGYTMPGEREGFHEGRYSGNRVTAKDVPGLERPIVWDNSNNAGNRNGDMKQAYLGNGAAAFLGFGSVNYEAYSSYISRRFFRHGDTLGESLKDSVNDLRSASLVYNPASAYRTGVRQKMEKSLGLYGNPEMEKDPVKKPGLNSSKKCSNGTCTLDIEVAPEPKIVEKDGRKRAVFNTSQYLLQDFAPITPLYKFSREMPEDTEVISREVDHSYRTVSGLEPRRNTLLGHGGSFYNMSLYSGVFPKKVYRLDASRLEYVQAAVQYGENSSRVLERSSVEVVYKPPVTLDLEEEDGQLVADIYSGRDRNVTLGYSLNGAQKTLELDLREGSQSVELEQLEPGDYRSRGYLYKDSILARDSSEISVTEDVEVVLFAPDIRKGHARKVRAIVENPNEVPVRKRLKLETSGNLQTGFLEERERNIEVGGGESVEVSWRITGISEGKGEITLGNESENISVLAATNSLDSFSPSRMVNSIHSPGTDFRVERRSNRLKLSLETRRGSVRLEGNTTHETSEIKTPGYLVHVTQGPERIVRRASNQSGRVTEILENGETYRSVEGNAPLLQEKLEVLEREVAKLRERYQVTERSMLNTKRKTE